VLKVCKNAELRSQSQKAVFEQRIRDELTPIISDFQGSATVSVASVGVPPMDRCAPDNFTRSVAIRALR